VPKGLREVLSQLHSLAELPPTTPAGAIGNSVPPSPRRGATRRAQGATATAAEREAELLAYKTRAFDSTPDNDPGAQVLRVPHRRE